MKKSYLLLIFNLITIFAFAQSVPYMVKDIDTAMTEASMFNNFADLNGTLIMGGLDSVHGRELWRSDGTAQGTYMIKDIVPGSAGSNPFLLLKFGSAMLFFAQQPLGNYELWKTDGSSEGTVLITQFSTKYVNPGNFMATNTQAFFSIQDSAEDNYLWKTDGTVQGTQLVQTFPFLDDSTYNTFLTDYNQGNPYLVTTNSFLFYAFSDVEKRTTSIYRTDGTAEGTLQLGVFKAYYPGLWKTPNYVYFRDDSSFLWRTDGTVAGTTKIKLNDITATMNIDIGCSIGDTIICSVWDSAGANGKVWRTDGTIEGTRYIDSTTITSSGDFFTTGNSIYFFATGTNGFGLHKIDSTLSNIAFISQIISNGSTLHIYAYANNRIFFSNSNSKYGSELWVSDGTAAGTMMVEDINPGPVNGLGLEYWGDQIVGSGNKVFFDADNGKSIGFYVTDGTQQETQLITTPEKSDLGTVFSNFVTLNSAMYFFSGSDLYKSDGIETGTVKVKSFNYSSARTINTNPISLVTTGNKLFFCIISEDSARLWVSDGTAAGIHQLFAVPSLTHCEKYGCSSTSCLTQLTAAGSTVYFSVGIPSPDKTYITSSILYKTDGTLAGTDSIMSYGGSMASFNSKLFFCGNSATDGSELYTTDGTIEGTTLVADINPGTASSGPGSLTVAGNTLYFTAFTEEYGSGLWKTDGTENGTIQVKSIPPGIGGNYLTLYSGNTTSNEIYFAYNSNYNGVLWKTDGTDTGTAVVTYNKDTIYIAYWLTNNVAYQKDNFCFLTEGALWKIDGTQQNTTQVYIGKFPDNVILAALDSFLVFSANTATTGNEPWISDGTTAGTFIIGDINPGPLSSNPSNFYFYNNAVYFTADDGVHGTELWRYDITSSSNITSVMPSLANINSNEILVYPNPGNGVYSIKFTGERPSAVVVYNSLGAVVRTQLVQSNGVVTIDISSCPAGMYMICSPEGDVKLSQKIIKE